MLQPSLGAPGEAPAEVELRDADPSTSGSAVCRLDGALAVAGAARGANSSGGGAAGDGRSGGGARGAGGQAASGGGGAPAGGAASVQATAVFPIDGGAAHALAQVLPEFESVMLAHGPQEVPGAAGASLGRTQTDAALRVAPRPPRGATAHQLHLAAALSGQEQARASPASGFHACVELPALDVSVVDQRPQELLLLSVDGLAAELHRGNCAGAPYELVALRVQYAQLDDMLPGTAFPVVAAPANAGSAGAGAGDAGASGGDGSGGGGGDAEPLVFYMQSSEPARLRNASYMPTVAGRVAALRLSVAEPIVWRLLDLVGSIGAATATGAADAPDARGAGGGGGGAAAATNGGRRGGGGQQQQQQADKQAAAQQQQQQQQHQQVAKADQPLQIDLLSLDDLALRVSLRTSRAARPRWAHRALVLTIGDDMLNFDDLALTVPGLELTNVRWAGRQIIDQVQRRLQDQAASIAFGVLKSYGVLGTASKLLAVGSNITAAIGGAGAGGAAGGGASGSGAGGGGAGGGGGASAALARGDVSSVRQGLVEGGVTFGKGVFRGVTGIVTNPLAGAQERGVLGFVAGVGRGLVGVPAQVVGGALAAASKVTEGIDASYTKVRWLF